MAHSGVLHLNRSEVGALLDLKEHLVAAETAFRWHGEGTMMPPGLLGMHAKHGGFHIKAALVGTQRDYFVAKFNANFPNNGKLGIPTIQGMILLMDAEDGRPLAIMDSLEITIQRTAAATALAAKHLSLTHSKTVTICGCGNQGRASLNFLLEVRSLEQAYVYDKDQDKVQRILEEFSGTISVQAATEDELGMFVGKSDICVTCTPSRKFFLRSEYVCPGTFIAAIGADSEDKQEIDPRLVASSKVVVDVAEQCSLIGELHHALASGHLKKNDVYAELGEVVIGKKEGRTNEDEVILFDSTGMALQDASAALMVYDKAISKNVGHYISFG